MKTGLFFGTFNPVHSGHFIITSYFAEHTDLDQVWMVVTPHNPHKESASLLNDRQRFTMVQEGIGDYRKIKASNIEFDLPKPNYTVNTLAYLSDRYPEHEFSLIMGSDNLETLPKWKNHEAILEHYRIYIYNRPGHDGGSLVNHKNVVLTKAPLIEISSSFIRKSIEEGKDVRYMLPETVFRYMTEMHFYEKKK